MLACVVGTGVVGSWTGEGPWSMTDRLSVRLSVWLHEELVDVEEGPIQFAVRYAMRLSYPIPFPPHSTPMRPIPPAATTRLCFSM